MDYDDIVYFILLLVSLFTGRLVKATDGCVARQRLVSGVGVAMVIVVCRGHCLHSLLSAVVNALIVLLVSARWVCKVVFAVFSVCIVRYFTFDTLPAFTVSDGLLLFVMLSKL